MALLDLDPEFRRRRLHRRRDEPPEFGRAPGIDKSHADIGAPGGLRGGGERCRKDKTTQPRRAESQRAATGEAEPLGPRQHISARPGSVRSWCWSTAHDSIGMISRGDFAQPRCTSAGRSMGIWRVSQSRDVGQLVYWPYVAV